MVWCPKGKGSQRVRKFQGNFEHTDGKGRGSLRRVLTLSQVSTGNVEGIHFALSRFASAYGSVEGERDIYHEEKGERVENVEGKGNKGIDGFQEYRYSTMAVLLAFLVGAAYKRFRKWNLRWHVLHRVTVTGESCRLTT